MFNYEKERKAILLGLKRALNQYTSRDIAKATGLPDSALYTLRSRGSIGTERMKTLATWLERNGYMTEGVSDPEELCRSMLNNMAALVNDPEGRGSRRYAVLRESLAYLLEVVIPQIDARYADSASVQRDE